MRPAVGFVLVLLAAPVAAAAGDWPQFRYNETHQGSVPSSANSEFKEFTENWWPNVKPLPAPVGSPSIRDGIVYVGDASGYVSAIDAESGGKLWSNKTASGTRVTGAPAAGQDFVYAITEGGGIYSFARKTGTLEKGYPIQAGATFGSLLLHEDILYTGSSTGTLNSYYASTRQARWSFSSTGSGTNFYNTTCSSPSSIDGTPVVFEDQVMFGSTNHCFFAVRKSSEPGTITKPNWVFKANEAIRSSPVVDVVNRRVIFGDVSGRVHAIPVASSGAVASAAWTWVEPADPSRPGLTTEMKASPAVVGDKVIVAARNGNVRALRVSDGTSAWSRGLGGEVTSSPAVANGRILVGSFDNKMYMLKVDDGTLLDTRLASAQIDASPAISGTQGVWASKDGTLHSYGGKKPDRADLAVLDLSAPGLVKGQPATLSATIKNVGVLKSEATTVRWFVGSSQAGEKEVPGLDPGKTQPFSASVTPPSTGKLTLRVFVDSLHAVRESDEANNDVSIQATVADAATGTSGSPSTGADEEKGIPGLEAPLAALGLLGVAWARRRRSG